MAYFRQTDKKRCSLSESFLVLFIVLHLTLVFLVLVTGFSIDLSQVASVLSGVNVISRS